MKAWRRLALLSEVLGVLKMFGMFGMLKVLGMFGMFGMLKVLGMFGMLKVS